jgi:hypothetical protein
MDFTVLGRKRQGCAAPGLETQSKTHRSSNETGRGWKMRYYDNDAVAILFVGGFWRPQNKRSEAQNRRNFNPAG